MKRFLSKGKKGFTIVELVIVIGVIGILSAILIPTFVNLNANAQRAARKSDLAAVYSSYVADVADGYYGEMDPAHPEDLKVDLMYGQQDICLKEKTGAAGNYYVYGTDGWTTDLQTAEAIKRTGYTITQLSATIKSTYPATTKNFEYSGYEVWAFVED